jgi:hypothetical protein
MFLHPWIGKRLVDNLGSQCDLPVTYCKIDNKGNITLKSLDK